MKKIFTLFLIFTLHYISESQTPQVVINNLGNNAPLYYFHQRKVAVIPVLNITMLTWTDKTTQGGQVVYSIYDYFFQTWAPPVAISSAPYNAIQSALATEKNNSLNSKIHATWQQRSSSTTKYEIYYANYNGTVWSTPIKISLQPNTVPCEEPSIDCDLNGNVWIVYNTDGAGAGKEFVFARKGSNSGTTWSQTLDTLSTGGELGSSIEVGRTSLANGTNGKMVAIWDNSLDGKSSRREVFLNQYDGSKWKGAVRISDTTTIDRDHNRYTTVAVDASDNIYTIYTASIISASDTRPRKLLLQKKQWNADWNKETFIVDIDSTYTQGSVSMTCDANNILHLAFRRDVKSDSLYNLDEIVYTYSKDNGTTWKAPLVVSRKNCDAGYVTIANIIGPAAGINLFWRESRDPFVNDQDTSALVYTWIPYSYVVGVKENSIPENYFLLSNYPNPFNGETTINFQLPTNGFTNLKIYNVLGVEVAKLINENKPKGNYKINFNANKFSSGIYFAKLSQNGKTILHKMLLVK